MSKQRFIVKCFWSGHSSSQSHVVHRTVERPKKAEHLSKVHCVTFSDGTAMNMDVRPCKPRERVKEIKGYSELLNKIWLKGITGCVHVDQLE